MKMFPLPSTAAPLGWLKPLPRTLIVGLLVEMLPLTAKISFIALLPKSATKTSPLPSTATPLAELKPLPSVMTVELPETRPPTATPTGRGIRCPAR